MLLKKTNIQERLARAKINNPVPSSLMAEVQKILDADTHARSKIEGNIVKSQNGDVNFFNIDLLETENIYHIGQIKEICITYRLRFLDTKYFKGPIPQEAISKIKALEKAHNTEIKGFKIIAPSKLFKLEDKDDPLLFAPIGNGYFYLVHKWGKDLHPLRKFLVWPFKNIVNLTAITLLISYLVTLVVPDGLFSKQSSNAEFWIIFFFMFKCIASVVIFYGFALGKNFNHAIWNSKYFNA
ncbi:hypothetical protein [Pareuzebyella sediminis]|uniref:hypothetical protein n=1 Tax=Pareuzebyella sediminis TaxID=2607998 RepID=UPI0011EF2BF5|nr:hypothetical protein [Pareuzebyella sediminis]